MQVPTGVNVKETPVLHASDLLRWLDGTSAPDLSAASMGLVDRSVRVDFSVRPPDLQWLHKPGRTALWRKTTTDIVQGEATEAERDRPELPTFRVAGQAMDPTGAYNPRAFDLTLGGGGGHDLVLHRSPQGTRFGNGGGLQGAVRFDGSIDNSLTERPAAWALLEIAVTVGAADIRSFRAQADGKGDFRLSLWRLPPLPQGTASYAAELTVRAAVTTTSLTPVDPVVLVPMVIGPVGAGDFAAAIPLSIVPGQVHRVQSEGLRWLAVRPPEPVPPPGP